MSATTELPLEAGRKTAATGGTVVWPLALVFAISVVSASWLRPMVALALQDSPGVRSLAELSLFVAAALSPFVALARSALLAGIVSAAAILIEERTAFRRLLRVFVIGEIALCSTALATAVIVAHRGAALMTSPEALYVPLGLDRLWTPADPLLLNVLRDVTVFHFAWIGIVFFGLRSRVGLTREGTLVGTLAAYAGLLGMAAVRAAVVT